MRKGIFSAVVITLAGTCWVVAQNASSTHSSLPYGVVPARAPNAQTPEEKAQTLTSAPPTEPYVAPATELEKPSIPPLPQSPNLMPAVELPPLPVTEPAIVAPADPIRVPVPNNPVYLPDPIVTSTPIVPAEPVRPLVQAVTTPAVPGLPALPAVPGVPSAPPGIPTFVGPAALGDGQPIVVPNRQSPPYPNGGNPPVWSVDDPGHWDGPPPLPGSIHARTLGPQFWAGADNLFWFVKSSHGPTLVQATSLAGTQTLFPNGSFSPDLLDGVRGTAGVWIDRAQTIGLEAGYFWFGTRLQRDDFQSSPGTVLGRSFFNAANGAASLFQISSLNGTNGQINVGNSIHVEGGDASVLLSPLSVSPQVNAIVGFRYFQVDERLSVADLSQNDAAGFQIASFDSFATRNRFYGGQVGLRWNYQATRFVASLAGKIALGAMDESVAINGATFFSGIAGAPAQTNGGVLALPTNIGSYHRTRLAFLPEASANIGYRFTQWATMFVGYNFTYVSNVVRPAKQIDPLVNTANFPGGAGIAASNPLFRFRGEDLWLQGINFGVRFQY